MTGEKLMPCPCCGSAATVEPHLIEAGCTVGDQTWTDWWTASVNCTSCALQFIGGGDTEEEAVENAMEGWNMRAATTDQQFAWAVHDGELWGKCSECKERQGYYLDAETIQRQQERIAELERERGEWQYKFCKESGLHVSDVFQRDKLIRDMYLQLLNAYDAKELDEFAERIRAIGIEVQP